MLLCLYMWKVYVLAILMAAPMLIMAAGLVPCGGPGEEACQTCHVVQLISTVVQYLVMILGVVAAILIVVSGLRLVVSAGDASAKAKAKSMISSLLIGYVIVLAGWMLVDLGLRAILNSTTYGVWNVIQCTAQPNAVAWSRPTASGDNASTLPPAAVASRVAAITSSGSLQADIAAAAAAAGITDPAQVNTLRALISQESSNCQNRVGPATASGVAYGCGQMLVSTARTLDSSLSGLSDAEVAARLQNDNAYNLTLSARYYNQLLTRYNNNTELALAAYNGGPGANQPSVDCPAVGQEPALRRWECIWDSPGCYGTGQTSCERNEGPNSYAQTRNYVSNITNIAAGL